MRWPFATLTLQMRGLRFGKVKTIVRGHAVRVGCIWDSVSTSPTLRVCTVELANRRLGVGSNIHTQGAVTVREVTGQSAESSSAGPRRPCELALVNEGRERAF